MIVPVYAILSSAPAVTSLVATRIFGHGVAPQNTPNPYVVFQVLSGGPNNNLSGAPEDDNLRVQVACWSTSQVEAETLMKAARDALEADNRANVVWGPADDYESDTTLWGWRFHVEFWTART